MAGNQKVIAFSDLEQITVGDLTAGETLALSNTTVGLIALGGAVQNGTTNVFQPLWGLNVLGSGAATVAMKAGAAIDGVNLGLIEVTADQTLNILSGTENQGAGIWGTGQAANATNPRKTVVGIKFATQDTDVASRTFWNTGTSTSYTQSVATRKQNHFSITVVHGVAAAVPAEPSLPAGYQKLAVITVPANATTIPDVNIAKARPYVAHRAPGLVVRPIGDLLTTDKIIDVQNFAGTTLLSVKQDGTMPELDARFVLATAKGAANGVATLDGTGKVPSAQLPAMNYVPTSDKGVANGVATLDATTKIPVAQIPALSYIPTSQRGAVNGVASLDGSGLIPTSQIPAAYVTDSELTTALGSYLTTAQRGAVNGVASLDGSGLIPDTQIPANIVRTTGLSSYVPTTQKGAANGVATLDAGALIPVAQIPTLAYVPTSQRGAINGVATLDGTGLIPDAQIPAGIARTTALSSYVPTTQKGAANGVATLDASTLIPVAQIPPLSYIPSAQKGAANGVATLDASTLIPVAQIPTTIARVSDLSSYVPNTAKGAASGVATLDATTKIPDAQIPAGIARTSDLSSYILTSQKGAASGVATLDGSSLIPVAQIPPLSYIPTTDKGSNSGVATLDGAGKLVQDAKTLGGFLPTTAGGTTANSVAVTDPNGAVGRANALKDSGGTYRTATSAGGTTANSVAVTDPNGRVGDSAKLGGQSPSTTGTANTIVQRDATGEIAATGHVVTAAAPQLDVIDTTAGAKSFRLEISGSLVRFIEITAAGVVVGARVTFDLATGAILTSSDGVNWSSPGLTQSQVDARAKIIALQIGGA
jgi:hypothetical protein